MEEHNEYCKNFDNLRFRDAYGLVDGFGGSDERRGYECCRAPISSGACSVVAWVWLWLWLAEAQRWREQRSACSRLVRWVQPLAIHIMAIMAILMDIMLATIVRTIGIMPIGAPTAIMPIGAPTGIMLITAGFIQDGAYMSATAITGGTVIIKPTRGFIL